MELKRLRIGNGKESVHANVDFDAKSISFEAGQMTPEQWRSLSQRIDAALLRAKLLTKVVSLNPRSHGSPVKSAPWFLKPWYTKVIPKEKHENYS